MKEFEFLLHATGVEIPVGEGFPAIGFTTLRRAYGETLDFATEVVLRSFAVEPKIREIIEEATKAGREPQVVIEESRRVGLLEQLKAYQRPGLTFYSVAGEISDGG